MNLIEEKEIEIDGYNFIISKLPAVEGREIIAKYPISNLPKLGEYAVSEETMLKLMGYVACAVTIPNDTSEKKHLIRLTNKTLINNHVKSWEILVKLEGAMLEYNCSFLQNGQISNFFANIAQNVKSWTTKTLTDSLQQLWRKDKPPSTN